MFHVVREGFRIAGVVVRVNPSLHRLVVVWVCGVRAGADVGSYDKAGQSRGLCVSVRRWRRRLRIDYTLTTEAQRPEPRPCLQHRS